MSEEEVCRVCFAGGPPQADGLSSDVSTGIAIAENPRNATLSIPIGPEPPEDPTGPLELAMYTSKFWAPGTTLRIRFLAGTDWQKDKVKTYAPMWCTYGNIKMQFINSGDCDILIDFVPTDGSKSYIGTDCRYFASQNQRTMNLGWINDTKSETDLRRVILHEFGHALGAVHEHQSPYVNIQWNKETVYTDLAKPPNNWDRAKVDLNMFTKYALDKVQATPFDGQSIMLYYYPATWTTDGRGTAYNTDLSDLDKSYIAFCYPKHVIDAGQFNTLELRPWNQPQLRNEKVKNLQKTYTNPPRIVFGLNWLDFDHNKNIRIIAEASNITTTSFKAGLNAWADTILYTAGMSYLELGSSSSYIRSGTFDTREIRPWNQPRHINTKRINFASPFQGGAPKVVCWINSMDFDHNHNTRLIVSATNIDVNGFTANITSWADSILYSAGMTWIAYPSNQEKVASGMFDTRDIRPWNQPRHENSNSASFGNAFTVTPKLIMGLNSVDYDHNKNLRCRVSTSAVTKDRFVWHLQSWADSIMYSAGASWFAWS